MPDSLFEHPELYDANYHTLTKDIRFYQKLAVQYGGPVLELGVGTGRIAFEILKHKIPLVGLDVSEQMLYSAKQRLKSFGQLVRLEKESFCKFLFNEKFSFIFSAFNSLHHAYSQEEIIQVFKSVYEHLTLKGVFAFDVANPQLDRLQKADSKPYLRERFFDERTQQACEVWETYEYNNVTQIRIVRWKYCWPNGLSKTCELKTRLYFSDELETLLKRSGFIILKRLGDFDGSAFNKISPKQILVCQKVLSE
jgi:SAM-dependent methyltransferase